MLGGIILKPKVCIDKSWKSLFRLQIMGVHSTPPLKLCWYVFKVWAISYPGGNHAIPGKPPAARCLRLEHIVKHQGRPG